VGIARAEILQKFLVFCPLTFWGEYVIIIEPRGKAKKKIKLGIDKQEEMCYNKYRN